MTQQSSGRPPRIRSREERESEASRLASSGESGPVVESPAVPADGVSSESVGSPGLGPEGAGVDGDGVREPVSDVSISGVPAQGESVSGDPVLSGPELDDIRRMAQSQGFVLYRERQAPKFRPDADARGGVRMTCRISSPVRRAMEVARMDLNVSYSQIIEAALSLYLDSRGFSVDPQGSVGSSAGSSAGG